MMANTGRQLISSTPVEPDSVRTSFLVEGSDKKCLERGAVLSCVGFSLRNQPHRQPDSYME